MMKDRAHAHYMQMKQHVHIDDPHLYDLVINTGVLDLGSAVNLICLALESKASQLHVPEQELGPVAGLLR